MQPWPTSCQVVQTVWSLQLVGRLEGSTKLSWFNTGLETKKIVLPPTVQKQENTGMIFGICNILEFSVLDCSLPVNDQTKTFHNLQIALDIFISLYSWWAIRSPKLIFGNFGSWKHDTLQETRADWGYFRSWKHDVLCVFSSSLCLLQVMAAGKTHIASWNQLQGDLSLQDFATR